MYKINILTKGFISPNACAFLFPIIVNKRRLIDSGISYSIFQDISERIYDCDVLILDSRYFSRLWHIYCDDQILKRIEELKNKINAVLFFDISDSTGWIESQVLPY